MTIKMQIVKPLDFKGVKSSLNDGRKQVYAACLALIVDDIVRGIGNNKAIVGGSFPSLEPETIALKGHSRPLIDKGLLRDGWTYQQLNQWRTNNGQITIKDRSKGGDMPRNRVGAKLQIEGVSSKHGLKHFYFFGVSKDAERDVIAIFDDYVLRALQQL